jgi:hypothetical protein
MAWYCGLSLAGIAGSNPAGGMDDEICALLGYYPVSSGNSLPTFRDNLSVPSSRIKKSKKKAFLFGLLDPLRSDRQ